jgi:glycosyltransferase involved in cell wall biosynthesis
MRILHVNDHLSESGGVETYLLSVCPALSQRGHDVHVAYGAGRPVLPQAHHVPEIASIRAADDARCARALDALIDRVAPDVIHMHGVHNAGAIRALVRSGRCVLHTHDYRPICPASNFFLKRPQQECTRTCGPGCFTTTALRHCMTPRPRPALYFYRRVRWNLAHRDEFRQVICPSRGAAKRYLQSGFEPSNLHVLPYFCPLEPTRSPRQLPKSITITFLGRATPTKGWTYFIQALGQLPVDVSGLMIGSFDEAARASARQLAHKEGCADRLRIEPWVARKDIRSVYERTTVLVFPSIWPETMGIVGVEALALGVPVVASDIGGVREWLRDGETGRLAAPKSAADLAAGVAELIEPALNQAYGRRGQQLIREEFNAARHLDRLTTIYEATSEGVR